jgi:hypothetical protein
VDQVLTSVYCKVSEGLVVDGSAGLSRSFSLNTLQKPTEHSSRSPVVNRPAESNHVILRNCHASSVPLERRTTHQNSMLSFEIHHKTSDSLTSESSRNAESNQLSNFTVDISFVISLLNVSMQPILDFLTQRLVSLKLWLHGSAFQLITEALSMHIAEVLVYYSKY